jgi:glyoxylase-like metal-dependent hydrolase (beta-lactamase superfamily II)
MLEPSQEQYRGLDYPWGRKQVPAPGRAEAVADGVWWVRLPMPGALDHINVWLLEDDEGWPLVDTGLALDSTRDCWRQLMAEHLDGKPVKRVICTHLHPDHTGLAGWLCEHFNCPLWMTREEYLLGRLMMAYAPEDVPTAGVTFYRATGFSEAQLDLYRSRFGSFGKYTTPLPHHYRRIVDRETLTINGRYWQVIIGRGHSPEHACLYCPALKLVIGGDQILPRITPNVSVFPTEPEGNPLEEWIASNSRLIDLLPPDLLVLPAHQTPYTGLHTRLNQIIDGHRLALARLYDALETPHRVVDCFAYMFKRPIGDPEIQMATGETLAHLNYLLHRGNVRRDTDPAGVHWYRQNPDTRYRDTDEALPIAT